MTPSAQRYLTATLDLCREVVEAETDQIVAAAELIAETIAAGHRWWAFGTGHSHILAEELWGRAGGIAEVHAILEPSLMLHEGLAKSSAMERLSGLAELLADLHGVADGDTILIASNSGRNAVPVELAEVARSRGARVIALTSRAHAAAVSSRVPSGNKLVDVADVVIDNHGAVGDAILPWDDTAVGATSTVVGSLIVQAITAEVVGILSARGVPVQVHRSQNS